MYTAQIKNSGGESLRLTQNEEQFQVVNIAGLNPVPAHVNLTDVAGLDGGVFNSSKLNTRDIVITLKINGDAEENRQLLYLFFRTKEPCTFYFKNQNRDVSIEGYVETVEVGLFSNAQMMQVSIICPDPYFRALQEIAVDISNLESRFFFPFAIDEDDPVPFSTYTDNRETTILNRSEAETGMIIRVEALADFSSLEIRDTGTGEYILLSGSFETGDLITINTNPGKKGIRLTRDGVESNAFRTLQRGSTFLQLAVGVNTYSYLVDGGENDEAVSIVVQYTNAFRGV